MFTFPKQEKLCGQLRIAALYKHGKRFTIYPLRITYLVESQEEHTSFREEGCPQVLIWAPKSLFKRANKRNRLRRLMREAYRLNAVALKQKCQEKSLYMQIAFNYIAKEEMDYQQIEKAMQKALAKLSSKL